MEILTSVGRLYIRFKSVVNDFVYSFGRAAVLLLAEVLNQDMCGPDIVYLYQTRLLAFRIEY
jgi:hypothetical protein